MIIIDGQIGVGKTTLGKALEEEFKIPLYRELSNSDTIAILDNFYNDKKRWGFTSQVHFLSHRFQMIKQIQEDGRGILDRSIFGDSIFAEALYEDQYMTKEEFNTYKALLNNMLDLVKPPFLLIYLDCNTHTAMERIKIRNRDFEKIISHEYLDKINSKYLTWYEEYNSSPKLFIDTNNLNIYDPNDKHYLISLIAKYIQNYAT